ncbi:hypothetical protein JAO10_31260 [Burkholderia contaminans]|uniref:hypothetical protein n=1 Tax=Burkholderia cepacia complex TaxID=87882 RepID=UPI001041A608|nr:MULTISPECIES: hypothetical protein [Burkholderia cepacia complex]MBH9724813.1 hypothetical protein [Burkholderia contaminans]MBR8094172.1 hypothetical protein [Burkholderia cenocepacia]MBY4710656.1 hypothetical protein [Burkholderia cepacia]MBY4737162.1 hypothetical protein [Burkholderia cepacia]MBY4744500.1 hypothetical protein [Burkholderia cepacia]
MNDMNGQGNGEEPDYQAAFKRACADISAINALLGFDGHLGIDRILRVITDLQLASRTRSVPEGLTAALTRYDALMASVEGCTDGGCVIRAPEGMHTNGGCRCTRAEHKMRRAMYASQELHRAVAALSEQPAAGVTPVEMPEAAGGTSDAQAARAIEIADQSMVELLLSHAVRSDALTPAFGLSAEDGTEVETLEEADPAIQEAFEWLESRGMAELLEEAGGTCILLKGHSLEYLNL